MSTSDRLAIMSLELARFLLTLEKSVQRLADRSRFQEGDLAHPFPLMAPPVGELAEIPVDHVDIRIAARADADDGGGDGQGVELILPRSLYHFLRSEEPTAEPQPLMRT